MALTATNTDELAARSAAPRFYRPELDGLRFLAFLGVFVHHALPRTPDWYAWQGLADPLPEVAAALVRAGAFGVDLFFVLSAYLITELLLREHETRGRVDPRAFLIRRALRIWPLFFFFLVASVALDRLVLDQEGLSGGYVLAFLGLAGNWACALFGYPESVAAPLWSISIEEQFYLAFPFGLARLGPGRLRSVGVALLALGAASRLVTALSGTDHPAVWCSTLCRVDTIGVGILLALALRARPGWTAPAWLRGVLGAGGLSLWIAVELAVPVEEQTLLGVSVGYPMVYAGATAMVLAALGSRGPLLTSPLSVGLGRISYGLYVFHVAAVALAALALQNLPALGGRWQAFLVLAFGLTVAFALASYLLLERPFLRLKGRFTLVPSRD